MNEQWGRRLFNTGAVALLILGLVHSISLFEKRIPANNTEKQLMDLMANYQFNLMGSLRSMGFGAAFMLAPFAFGALDLMLSRERAGLLKRVALLNAIWLAALTAVSVHYFFPLQLPFSLPRSPSLSWPG